jgi:ribosomal-protein-alanine N-acetyltransferase
VTAAPSDALEVGRRVYLQRPGEGDVVEVLAAVRRSRALHRGRVEPPRTEREYAAFLARARRGDRLHLIRRRDDRALVGVVNLSRILPAPFQQATLGYFAFRPHAGAGLMGEAIGLALRQAFRRLKLHRVEAEVQLDNAASIALLRRHGFRREGVARRLARLAGAWRDHARYALLREAWRPARLSGGSRPRGAAAPAGRRARGGG